MKKILFFIFLLIFTSCSKQLEKQENQQLNIEVNTNIDSIADEKKNKIKKIAFIGDSHFASDYMPHFFRKNLNINTLCFINPTLPKWHIQNQLVYKSLNVKTDYIINTKENLAFSGINAKCDDNCLIKISTNFTPDFISALIYQNEKWLINDFYISNENEINYYLDSEILLGGFVNNTDSCIDNLAINGASVFNYGRINKDTINLVGKTIKYDLIIFSFGTNESVMLHLNEERFYNYYKNIILLHKENTKNIVLIIPPEPTLYIDKKYVKGKNNDLVKSLIYKLAKDLDCKVFDADLFMSKTGGKDIWIEEGKSLKNTHLTKSGYELLSEELLKFLKQNYKEEI